jgi:8-oxo-dGTP pyrophosphatase MutT (NUDIX family)
MKNYWKKLGSQTLFEHPRLTVVEDEVELPNGKRTKYMLYEGLESYVTVIAEQDDKVLLVNEYSYPHDEWLWQFPEGGIEEGEEVTFSAGRELEEEAGVSAKQITQIGMNYDHHRRTKRKNYILRATGLTEVSGGGGDAEEAGIKSEWFTISQINQMIKNGQIVQKNTLAAWPIFLLQTDRIKAE